MPFDVSAYPTHLSGLTDREQIADALYRALLAFDHNDPNLFRSAMATTQPPMLGTETIIEQSVKHVGQLDTQHLVSGIRIDIKPDGKSASLMCNALNQHMRAGEGFKQEKDNFLAGSIYEMEYVKEEGGWKIAKWVLRIIYTQGTRAVFA